jgi:predicted Zn-dependent peptidase
VIARKKGTAAAICACVSLLAFNAPVASAQAQSGAVFQRTGALSGGGTYILRRDASAPTASVELWYRAPGAGYDNATPGVSRLAITALAASAPPHGRSLAELVTRLGGSLSINVYPDIAMVGASVPVAQAPGVLRALTHAYFEPAITTDGLKAALRDCAIGAAEAQFEPEHVLQDALFARIFTAGPAHFPPTPGSARDFTKIPESAVKAFAARAFRRQNAFLTVSGGVDAGILGSLEAAAGAKSAADAPIDSTLTNAPINAVQGAQIAGLGFAWVGPPIADAKAATAMDFIADYLFDADHGTLAQAVRTKQADAFVNGQFITLHKPGVLLVTVAGGDANAARSQILAAAASMTKPLDEKTFAAARNAFEYHIMSQTQTPAARADNFGWYAAEGNPGYAPGDESGEYVKAVESLDPGYVAEVARKYLQNPAIVQLLAGEHGTGTAI